MIPCEKCRNNYKKHLKQHPLTGKVLSSRDNLFMWIIDVHNSVHKDKQKTYDDTFKYYMDQYNVSVNEEENKVIGKCSTKVFYFMYLCFVLL